MTVDLIVAYKNVPLYDKINIAEIGVPTSSEDETVPGCLNLFMESMEQWKSALPWHTFLNNKIKLLLQFLCHFYCPC
jgi:hypothetical protein